MKPDWNDEEPAIDTRDGSEFEVFEGEGNEKKRNANA